MSCANCRLFLVECGVGADLGRPPQRRSATTQGWTTADAGLVADAEAVDGAFGLNKHVDGLALQLVPCGTGIDVYAVALEAFPERRGQRLDARVFQGHGGRLRLVKQVHPEVLLRIATTQNGLVGSVVVQPNVSDVARGRRARWSALFLV